MKTPVAFLIFNRPETTKKVFDAIRQAKPPKLLVIADGPRSDRPDDVDNCAAARKIIDQVDWDCEVLTNYSSVNLGCKRRVSSGLDWVFSTVEEAIILEDDCLPHPTFFPFCEYLLKYYRHDNRIASISGQNVQFSRKRTDDSYYFSRYSHIWGWASWQRVWKHYDVAMNLWSTVRDGNWLKDLLGDESAVRYWTDIFQSTYEGNIDNWDYQWTFACWIQNYLSIISNVNLISNIGFGTQSTHTASANSPFANIPTEPITFPLKHPPFLVRDSLADDFTQRTLFKKPSLLNRAKSKLKQIVFSGKMRSPFN